MLCSIPVLTYVYPGMSDVLVVIAISGGSVSYMLVRYHVCEYRTGAYEAVM